jgi:hypothetical protein
VKAIIHGEFVPPNTAVKSEFYCDILRRLRENVIWKFGIFVQPQLTPPLGKWRTFRMTKHQQNDRKSIKTDAEKSMSSQTPLGSVMEFARRSEQKNWTWAALLLHHDNDSAYTCLRTTEFVTNNDIVIVPQPPYSPDLAPRDFALFPKLKMKLKARRFETVSDMQRE